MKFKSTPKWVTSERQYILANLFVESGNNCLLGHRNCSILSHYLHTEYRYNTYAKAVDKQCFNTNGEPLKDKQGNKLYITVYQSVKYVEASHNLVTQYELLSDKAIKYWRLDDKQQSQSEWKAERKAIHALNEKPYKDGRFGSVSSVIWHETQPLYYIESVGMNGLTCKPFVKVKLSSSYQHLYVDLGNSLRGISKNRKRKAIRYGKPLPYNVNEIISQTAFDAVKDYLK